MQDFDYMFTNEWKHFFKDTSVMIWCFMLVKYDFNAPVKGSCFTCKILFYATLNVVFTRNFCIILLGVIIFFIFVHLNNCHIVTLPVTCVCFSDLNKIMLLNSSHSNKRNSFYWEIKVSIISLLLYKIFYLIEMQCQTTLHELFNK